MLQGGRLGLWITVVNYLAFLERAERVAYGFIKRLEQGNSSGKNPEEQKGGSVARNF
jgi:hypothetical protein